VTVVTTGLVRFFRLRSQRLATPWIRQRDAV